MATKKKKKQSFSEQVISGSYETSFSKNKVSSALKKTNESMTKAKTSNDRLLGAFDDGYDFGDVTKTILTGGKKLAVGTYNVGKEFVTNPIQTAKTTGISLASGIDKADTAISGAVGDFFNWITNTEDDDSLTFKEYQKILNTGSEKEKQEALKKYEEKFGKNSFDYQTYERLFEASKREPKNAIEKILTTQYYETDTYKKAQEGKLSKGQQTVWNVGENIGNMVPSIAVSTVATPLAGSTVFFTQAQQNYTEEAKTRGYTDAEARTYGLIMGGAEVLVERLGFDELGGLNKLATGSIKKAMVGEGLEEFVMPYIDSTVKSIGFGEEFDLQGTTEEALESAVMGAVTGGIMRAGGKGLQSVDSFIEKVNSGQEITQNDFVEAGREIEQNDPNYFNEIMKDVPKVVQDQIQNEDLAPVKQAGQQDIAPIKEAAVNPKQQNYQYKAQSTDSVQRRTISEDASKYANNTTRTHEFVDTVVNVSEATGETIRLTNNQSEEMTARRNQLAQNYARINNVTIEEATKRFEGTTIDAYNTGKEIVINLDSPKALNRLVGHEVTHSLEGTKEYSNLQKIAIEYAKTKGEYNDRVSTIQALYEGTNASIDNELTSDLVGDYLFTDQNFINHLHTQDRNVFQKIYDEIKHLIKMATAGSKEARQLEQLKHSFEKAMRENKTSKTTTIESKSNLATEVESNTQEKENQVTKVENAQEQSKVVEESTNNAQETKETVQKRKTMTQKRMETLEGTTRTNQQGYEYVIPKSLFQGKRTTKTKSDSITLAKYGEGEYYTPRRARAEGYGKVTEYNNMEGKFQNPYIQGTPYNSKMIELLEDFKKNNPDRASHIDKALKQGFPLTQEYMTPQEIRDLYLEAGYDSFIGGTDSLPEYLSFTKTNESVVSNTTDNKGRALTKEQEAFFKDSKVRDGKGNLLTMYHGTSSGGHTVFDPWGAKVGLFGQGSYFTDNKSVAESYTEKGRGSNQQIYEVYLNITNPIDMDAQGDVQAWAKALSSYGTDIASHLESGTNEQIYRSALDYLAEEGTYDKYERAEIMAETFEKMGYDGITHIGGGRFNKQDGTRHRVYISLDSSQVKNVDNTNPTEDADIRYSLSNTDNKGRELSKEQVEFFKDSKVRDENGKLLEVYHGSRAKGVNIFNYDPNRQTGEDFGKAFYFTSDYIKAKGYQYDADSDPRVKEHQDQERAARKKMIDAGFTAEAREEYVKWLDTHSIMDILEDEAYIVEHVDEIGGETKRVYLNITNPLMVDAEGKYFREVYPEYFERARKNDNDGIIVKNVIDNPRGEPRPIDVYIAFNENQIKNVDNLNPTNDPDIRYSLSDNQGRTLTKNQQEFFKDVSPELKDENNNLKVLYHGSTSEFTIFDLAKGGESNGNAAIGFWFTETKEGADNFASDIWYGDRKPTTYETYLNIKNPKVYENVKNDELKQQYRDETTQLEEEAKEINKKYSFSNTYDYTITSIFQSFVRNYEANDFTTDPIELAKRRGISEEQANTMLEDAKKYVDLNKRATKMMNEYNKLRYSDSYEQFKIDLYEVAGMSAEDANIGGIGMSLNNREETIKKYRDNLIAQGYDGIVIKNTRYDAESFNGENNQYVAFYPNQIKNVDNLNPTSDPDIRYSLSEEKKPDYMWHSSTKANIDLIKQYGFRYDRESSYFATDFDISRSYGEDMIMLDQNNFNIKDVTQELEGNDNRKLARDNAIAEGYDGIRYQTSKNNYDVEITNIDKLNKVVLETEAENQRLVKALMGEDYSLSNQDTDIAPTSDPDIRYSLSENELKQQQLDIILKTNPMLDDYHVGIRSVDDIKTFEEAMQDDESFVYGDFELEDAEKALKEGKVTVYSSKPIEQGGFVSTSYNMAKDYAGRGKVYSQTVALNEVAWINGDEGQYAKVDTTNLSLSNQEQDIAPTSADIFGSEVKLQQQVQEAIAPLQETIQELNEKITTLQESIAPIEGYTDEDISLKNDRNFESLENQNIAPIENTTPEYQYENSNEETPINDPFKDRDIKEVGKRNVKAYMYENPEVKPYFQQAAREMLSDLDNSIKGEKVWLQEYNPVTGLMETNKVTGTQRLTTSDIADLLDNYKYTYAEIRKGLNDIIEDNGKENNAVSKRIEFMLHDRLMDGYTAVDGFQVPPSNEYRALIRDKDIQAYTDQAYQEWSSNINQDELIPIDNASNMNVEAENIPLESDLAPSSTNTPSKTNEPRIENIMFADPMEAMTRQAGQQINEGMTYKKSEPKVSPTKKQQAKNMFGKLQDQFVNRNYYIDKMAKETGNKQIKIAGDMVNNFWAEIDGEIFTAQTDNNGNAIGDSLSSLFEPSKKGGYYEAFNDYLMHQSNIDRHQVGKGSVVPLEYSRKMVAEYEKMYPNMRAEATKVWKYGKNLLANMQSNGLITGQFNSTLQKMYPHYVPFMFDQEFIPSMEEDGTVRPKKAIKRAEGGAYEILEIEEAFAKYTYRTKRAIRENSLYKEIVKSSNDKVSIGADVRLDPTNIEEGLGIDDDGKYYVTAYVDGQMKQATISEDLFNELTKEAEHRVKAIEERYELITKPLQKASEWRRNLLTTWSPTFLITNPIKDIQDAVLNSKYTGDFLKFYPSSFKELAQAKTKEAKQFLTLYGSGNTMGEYNTDTLNPKAKNNNFIKKLGSGVSKANNILELAPRFAEFKASLKNGTSVQEAVYNAREVTLNFGRGGYITKSLNRNGFTFLNASVQGFDKLVRNFSGENGAKGVVSSFAKVGMFALAPALINALAFGVGDDEDEDYKALPDYIKDNYYIIKTEDGEFIRIPKGRMLSVFGSAGRRTLELLNGEKDAFEGYLTNAYSQVGVQNPLESNLFAPIIQAVNNKAWYGGDLVPTRLQDKPAEEQYDETTDEFSKWLGGLIGVSPYKINYVLDQYSGGIGDLLLPTITEEASSDGSFLAPIKDKFTANSTSDNKYVSEFYDKNDELKIKANSSKATEEDILKNKYMYSVSSEMSKLYQERRDVQNDDTLSKFEKYVRVQKIQEQINSLAEEGLNNYEKINKTSNYAIVGDREYYKDANDEWRTPYEDELDELNSFGMDVEEKSDYFKAKNSIYEITEDYRGTEDMYAEKKAEIIDAVKNSNLTNEQKGYLYSKYYAKEKTQIVNALDMDFDSFLDYESQNFVADKDKYGNSINGSKKTKVFDYINSLNGLTFEEKVILAKLEYNSYDEWNYEIIDYLNNSPITYEEEVYILKKLGFEVDNEGNIYWD